MCKMNRKAFRCLFWACLVLAFSLSIVLTMNNFCSNNQVRNYINQKFVLSSVDNDMNQTEKADYDAPILKLIDWGGQGTISWGLGFLAAITVFFAILLSLRPKGMDNDQASKISRKECIENNPEDFLLSFLTLLFLAVGIISIFQIAYYYRYVAYLQHKLLTVPPPPRPLLYNYVESFCIEGGMVALFGFLLIMALSCLWRSRKCKK